MNTAEQGPKEPFVVNNTKCKPGDLIYIHWDVPNVFINNTHSSFFFRMQHGCGMLLLTAFVAEPYTKYWRNDYKITSDLLVGDKVCKLEIKETCGELKFTVPVEEWLTMFIDNYFYPLS